MDQSQTNILAYVAFAVGLVSSVLAAINHQRLKSACCGRVIEVSLDIERTTPKDKSQENK
jgi:hypothetical protein